MYQLDIGYQNNLLFVFKQYLFTFMVKCLVYLIPPKWSFLTGYIVLIYAMPPAAFQPINTFNFTVRDLNFAGQGGGTVVNATNSRLGGSGLDHNTFCCTKIKVKTTRFKIINCVRLTNNSIFTCCLKRI